MAITAAQLAEIREWIGTSSPPTDATLEEHFDDLGTTAAVARRIVRQRLADLVAKAAKFKAEGDYDEETVENITLYERLEARLDAAVVTATAAATGTGSLTVGHIVREGRCR